MLQRNLFEYRNTYCRILRRPFSNCWLQSISLESIIPLHVCCRLFLLNPLLTLNILKAMLLILYHSMLPRKNYLGVRTSFNIQKLERLKILLVRSFTRTWFKWISHGQLEHGPANYTIVNTHRGFLNEALSYEVLRTMFLLELPLNFFPLYLHVRYSRPDEPLDSGSSFGESIDFGE